MKVNEISAEGFLDMIGSNEAMVEKEPDPVQEQAPESSAEGFLEMFGHYDGQAVDAVTKEDPERALRVNRAATELNIPNAEAALDLDAAEKKIERNKVGELINDSPKFTGFLARNASTASMFKNDLEIYAKAEKSLAKFGVQQNEEGEFEQLAMTETSLDIARANVSKNINLGWASGSATVELGNLYYKWSQGEVTYDEIKDREAELQKIIQERKDSDSYVAATLDTLGMMFKAAENFSVEHMGAAGAVGAAYVKAAQLVPGVGQALKALALAGSFGSMYKIEKGFMYADSMKQGASHEEAYKASEATGLINAGVESANFAFIGKAFGPLLKYFKAKNVIQSAGALTAPTARKVIADSVKAAVVGTGSEVSTEVIQEFVNVAGEAWLNETAGTDFDLSYDAIEDRMIETAYDTFRGTVLLSGLGMTSTITAGIKKVHQAEKTRQFFADLHEEMKQSEVVKNAPEVASEAVQEMAEGSGVDTVYVDAYELQQAMTEANVSAEQLEMVVPGIAVAIEQKVANREDVEIPVGTYAAKVAGTDFGLLLQQHVRLRPDDISVAEAVKVQREQQNMMRGILDGTVDDTAIEGNISRFEGISTEEVKTKESALKAIREQIAQAKGEVKKQLQASATALRSEIREAKKAIALQYKAEYDKLKKQYAEQIKVADVEGKKKDADIAHEAKYGAWLVTNLARRAGLKPERIAELAPKIGVNAQGGFAQTVQSSLYWKWIEAGSEVQQLRSLRSEINKLERGIKTLKEQNVTSIAAIPNALYNEFGLASGWMFNDYIRKLKKDNKGKRINLAMVLDAAKAHIEELKQQLAEQQKVVDEMGGEDYPEKLRQQLLKDREDTLAQTAWHASPHKFDVFSLDFIGTGEGGQAHGWGLYFAKDRETANYYRPTGEVKFGYDSLDNLRREMERKKDYRKALMIEQFLMDGNLQALERYMEEYGEEFADDIWTQEDLDWFKSEIYPMVEAPGRLFKVEIPDNNVLLDEQKTFEEQPEFVQQALLKLGIDKNQVESKIGEKVYALLVEKYGSPKAASLALNGVGVKGITYHDLRDGRCYVIFDDKAIKVLEFMQKGQADQRGSFSITSNQVTLTPNADLSTFAHEMGHWYLETLFAIYGETTSASVRSDVEVMLKDFGLKSVDDWNALPFNEREVLHERFAFYVEQYLAEGKAPTKESEGFFNRFGKWLLDVYKRFAGGPGEELNAIYRERFGIELPPMSDEVRRVLDRMIAAENAMKTAEQAEGIQFLFEQKPEDMSDEEWERYLQDRDEAEAEATNKVYKRMARDEKWYKNARSKKLKEIQAQAEEIRSVVRDKVEKEVSEMPASKVFEMVTKNGLKISEKSLKEAGFDSVTIAKLKKAGCVIKDGMAVDAVRQLASAVKGYRNNRQFVADLLKMADRDSLINDITTKRCLKNYSETFDQKKIDASIADALHGEARGRAVATELSYLANDKQGRSRIYREAARRAAKQMVAGMPIGSVTVRKFLNAESRAARAALDAIANGDRYAAVMAKRAQLVNHEAALIAIDLEKKKAKLGNIRTTVFKGNKKLAKTRDIDVINVIRYVLTNMGLGKGVALEGDEQKAKDYVKKLSEYDPEKYAIFDAIFKRYPYRGQVNFNALPVSAVLDLIDDVQVLYMQSRESKVVMLEGKRIDREEVVGELLKQFNSVERKPWDGGVSGTAGGDKAIAYRWMGIKSVLTRVESWCRAMDGGENGPFFNYIFLPIANAAAKFRNENTRVHEEMLKILKPMIDKWSKVRDIYFDEVGYMFTSKADLIGAILHTGNLSNKYKMLLGGRGDGAPWATKVVLPDGTEIVDTSAWDNFIARMMQDGVVTKEDMDAVQAIWDLTESMKPAAQAAYKKMYGTYFEEVEASEVVTPFGTYRGGYVPAVTDRLLVPEEETKAEMERITQQDFVSQMPVHEPGFSKTRVPNYTKPLAFDLGLLCGHMQNVLKFSYIGPVAQEVAKILYDREFKSALDAVDPTWVKDMLAPWLKRSYEQTIGDGKTGLLNRTANKLRSIAGMNIMAGHIVNALQQTTGLTIAATKVDPKYMGKALVNLFSREASLQEMTEMSEFMKARIKDRAIEYQSKIERIARTPEYISQAKGLGKLKAADAKLDPLRDLAERHAYCFQVAMQAPVDCIVWFGAFMQALDQGMAQNQAIAEADSVVRTTLSDFAPENLAAVETGNALKRCFLVFYNYFGMQLNLLGERWEGTKQTKKYGKFALDAALIVWIPSVLAEIIMQMIYGFDTGDDDEFDLYDGLRLIVGPFFKNIFAMIPFFGGAINSFGSREAKKGNAWAEFVWGDDPFVGRAVNSPAIDMIDSAIAGINNMIDVASEDDEANARTATRNMLDLVSVVTRLPVGALKKPGGWLAGYLAGDIEPESTLDVVQGLLSGKDTSK